MINFSIGFSIDRDLNILFSIAVKNKKYEIRFVVKKLMNFDRLNNKPIF